MFHFPTFPPHALCVQAWVTGHDSCRVSPFGHPRISARLAAPRGFSQPSTSFFGSWCLGIHRMLFVTFPQRCSRPLCSSQGTGVSDPGPAAAPATAGRSAQDRPDEETVHPLPQDPTAYLRSIDVSLLVPADSVCCTSRSHLR